MDDCIFLFFSILHLFSLIFFIIFYFVIYKQLPGLRAVMQGDTAATQATKEEEGDREEEMEESEEESEEVSEVEGFDEDGRKKERLLEYEGY